MFDFLAQPLFQRLGLVLLHFLWQGAAIALGAAVLLRVFDRRSPASRYGVSLGALALLAVCPLVTFALVSTVPNAGWDRGWDGLSNRPRRVENPSHAIYTTAVDPRDDAVPNAKDPRPLDSADPSSTKPLFSGRHNDVAADSPGPTPIAGVETGPPVPAHATPGPERVADLRSRLRGASDSLFAYGVLFWMAGVFVFGTRLLVGFAAVRRLRRGRIDVPPELLRRFEKLCGELGLKRRPGVFACRKILDAMAIGFFRPVILLPLSWVAQLPPDVLHSVLAHELAHIRRWDRWVNLLQRLVEVLLFYHPAVWWISRRVRLEREHCCDAAAAAAVGENVLYAEALERVARLNLSESKLLLATTLGGTKMALLNRVKRVLGQPPAPQRGGFWAVGLLAIGLPLALCLTAVQWQSARAARSAVLDDREKGDRDNDDRERGDRERGERERGERERGERERREGEARRDREANERRERDERRDRATRGEGAPNLRDLIAAIRDLRAEVKKLRQEVNLLKAQHGMLRGQRGPRPPFRGGLRGFRPPRRDGDRPRFGPGAGDRPRPPRGEGDRPRPPRGEGDRPRGERDRPRGERERPRGERDRDRPRDDAARPRREGDRPRSKGDREEKPRERPDKRRRSEEEQRIESSLDRPISLRFQDTPLREVMKHIATVSDVNIVLDGKSVPAERKVTIAVNDVSLKTALKALKLDYAVEDEVLKISGKR